MSPIAPWLTRAKASLLQAFHKKPSHPPARDSADRGNTEPSSAAILEIHGLIARGATAEADARLATLLKNRPNDPDLQFLLGLTALRRNDKLDAAGYFENALALRPDLAAAHVQLAQIYASSKEPGKAREHFEAAIRLMPRVPELHNALGQIHVDDNHLDEAERCFRAALEIDANLAAAHNNLGRVHSLRKAYETAIDCFRRAMELDPADVHARLNEALALDQLGEHEAALEKLLACRAQHPNHAATVQGLGTVMLALGRLDEAARYYRDHLASEPDAADAQFGLANITLLKGDLRAGWPQYESRMRLPAYAHNYEFVRPLPDTQPIEGRTLRVSAEQGYGDILLFSRFLPVLKGRGARVTFRCYPALSRLFMRSFPGVEVISTEAADVDDAQASIPLLSLAHLLGIGLDDLPGRIPYLRAGADALEQWRKRIAGGDVLRVGLAWGGNTQRAYQRGRVPPMSEFRALGELDGVAFHNLQLGFDAQTIAQFPLALTDFTSEIADFADTAAIIEHLDLVISVDTSVAHLSGALGKPTWLLHPGVPDWRWEIAGKESPWYPTVRLFRRGKKGWAPAIASVVSALTAMRKSRSTPPTPSGTRPRGDA